MDIILKTLTCGSFIGMIHFIIVGILYQNPIVAKIYKDTSSHPGVKKWDNKLKYIISMFLGTQLEVYIISVGFIFLISILGKTITNTLILGFIISGIRVYPRFWNMWIQSSYPNKLLIIEFINGTIGSFVIVFGLYLLPI
ncbi:MAG: hypothetical protein A2086_13365 [Spirochaetes bacterium GWD1_27_9]|nr:MAG: hypothetical protein A2Z98_01765 [Spirochaetes bacterium GWB1_27_13]OHD25583.1 MAG: hypothetical protein A2Y34_06935 [Spirochaetes bacterium GWC1_27_15]OHD45928.1 MAG: hypothetical protein A2086_13365 [Spirochaetes bacterium GWD1_27_9]